MTDDLTCRPNRPATIARPGEAGVSLIEALVALAVLMLSVVALLRWQSGVAVAAESWRERSAASLEVRHLVEARRVPAGAPAVPTNATTAVEVVAGGVGVLAAIEVTRRWIDRRGEPQAFSLALQSPVPDLDRVDFHDAGLDAPATGPRGAGHRHPEVPRHAVDLDPRTAWAPADGPTVAGWVIDRETGAVLGACRVAPVPSGAVPAAPTVAAGTARAAPRLPEGCDPLPGRLLSGVIRFAAGANPSAEGPYIEPLPMTMAWPLAAGVAAWPGCDIVVVRGRDPHLQWRCFVPAPSSLAEGAVPVPQLQPQGWSIDGPTPTHRLCRYVGSFAQTGFGPRHQLVVEEAADCPAGTTGAAQSAS